jgi:hypothetical protein
VVEQVEQLDPGAGDLHHVGRVDTVLHMHHDITTKESHNGDMGHNHQRWPDLCSP